MTLQLGHKKGNLGKMIDSVGNQYLQGGTERRWKSLFGLSRSCIDLIINQCDIQPYFWKPFLFFLYWCKVYASWDAMACFFSADVKTLQKKIKEVMIYLLECVPEVCRIFF